MKQSTFKKMLLIATFAVFTTIFTGINYCFGWDACNIVITHPEPEFCENCGNPNLIEKCEEWYDGRSFHIHTYECQLCGFWYTYYAYPTHE